jgi:hypothetical protein
MEKKSRPSAPAGADENRRPAKQAQIKPEEEGRFSDTDLEKVSGGQSPIVVGGPGESK